MLRIYLRSNNWKKRIFKDQEKVKISTTFSAYIGMTTFSNRNK